jgi:hypothetical protein
MELLHQAAEKGWTPELKARFIEQYDRQIGRWVLGLLAHYGIIQSPQELRALRRSIEARLEGRARESPTELGDIVYEVYVNVYYEVFQERFARRCCQLNGAFEKYLLGVVRHQFFASLGKEDLSEKELLDRMMQSKKLKTREAHLCEAKTRLWERARLALLSVPVEGQDAQDIQQVIASIHRYIDTITHYFFEKFLPERYPQRSDFERLLEDFRHEYYKPGGLGEGIIQYRARVPRRPLVQLVSGFDDEEGDDG